MFEDGVLKEARRLEEGAHNYFVAEIMMGLRERGLDGVRVMLGGIIPEADQPELMRMGVAKIFPPGTPPAEVVRFLCQQEARGLPGGPGR